MAVGVQSLGLALPLTTGPAMQVPGWAPRHLDCQMIELRADTSLGAALTRRSLSQTQGPQRPARALASRGP